MDAPPRCRQARAAAIHPPEGGHGLWDLPSLLDFARPSHAAWSDVVRWSNPQGADWLPPSLFGAGILIAYIWVHYATAVVGVTIWIVAAFALVGDPVANSISNRMIAATIVLLAVWIDLRAN